MSAHLGPVEVIEGVIAFSRTLDCFEAQRGRKWAPYGALRPDGTPWTIAGRIFQGRMWRQYAGAWDGIPIDRGYVGYPDGHRVILDRPWMEKVLRVSKHECLRRSRINFYLARRIRRAALNSQAHQIREGDHG